MATTTQIPRGSLRGPPALRSAAARELRFLLMDPLTDTDTALLGRGPHLAGAGERSALGLMDADGAPAARADLLVGPEGVGRWWVRVRVDLRGSGIGGALVDAACRHARIMGARCLHTQLRSGDTRAMHLLRRAGTPRTLRVDVAQRSVCVHLIVGGACDGSRDRPQCLCAAALRPHPPHRPESSRRPLS